MPVYVFTCPVCNGQNELLLKLGDTDPRPCPTAGCGGQARLKLSRVAVKYDSFGFTSTDRLVSDTRGKNLTDLRARAEQIADS